MTDTLQARWDEFHSQETDVPLQCTIKALETIALLSRALVGRDATNHFLSRHFENVGIYMEGEDLGDRICADGLIGYPEALKRLPIYHRLRNLEAYGMYGLPVEIFPTFGPEPGEMPVDPEVREETVHHFVEDFILSRLDIPVPTELVFGEEVRNLMLAGSGRAKLDRLHENIELTLDEIAALAGMNVKSVRNATTSKSKDAVAVDTHDRVDPDEAGRWLLNRRGFRTSIWHMHGEACEAQPANDNARLEKVIFVPMARDGSTFSPNDFKEGVYRVGSTANPEIYESFDEALRALQHMQVPRWHTPRSRGWTVYTADRWVRWSKEDVPSDA